MVVKSLIVVFLLVWGLFLRQGKGAFLISGYNTMSEEKKNKYDEKLLTRSMSYFAFALAFSNLVILIGDYFSIKLLFYIGLILTGLLIIALFFFMNFSKRLKTKHTN